jgi:predicted MFS family arabinose efflux permease
MPSMKAERRAGSANVFKLLKRPSVALGMAASALFFMGQFALFTYLRPFLEDVTGVGAGTLSILLLLIGAAGFVGTTLIGRFLKQSLYRTLAIIPALMALIAAALVFLGGSFGLTTLLLGIWGLVGTAAPVGWWTWLSRTLPQDAEAGGGLLVAVVQLAIMLGATLGGLLFDMSGYQATFGMSAVLLVLAALAALLAAQGEPRMKPTVEACA